jgi:hypothetical protein
VAITAFGRTVRTTSGVISGGQHVGRQRAEEDVGALDHLGEAARVGVLGVARLTIVHLLLAAAPDDAELVGDDDVVDRHAHVDEKI